MDDFKQRSTFCLRYETYCFEGHSDNSVESESETTRELSSDAIAVTMGDGGLD